MVGRMLVALVVTVLFPAWGIALEVGDEAPNFTLTDLRNDDHTLTGYSSHPVLLMFLNCNGAASVSVARLVQSDFYDFYDSRGLRILGIECHGNDYDELTHFKNQTGVAFPLLLDGVETLATYELTVPSFVIVDGSGIVRYISEEPGSASYDRNAMSEVIDTILREVNAHKEATWGLIKSLYSD
jgi:peroxiredoxin